MSFNSNSDSASEYLPSQDNLELTDLQAPVIKLCIQFSVSGLFVDFKIGRAMRKRVFGYMRTAKASACASTQSDKGLHYPLTESLDTIEYMNGEQMPG